MKRIATRLGLEALSYNALSRLTGRLAESRPPAVVLQPALKAFCRAYGVDLDESAEALASFPSFNAFFTRALKPGLRPIDPDPLALTSPADAMVQSLSRIEGGQILGVKGHDYTIAELLGDDEAARPFATGHQMTLYLSPRVYHRVHSPFGGRVTGWRHVPGRLYPVNLTSVAHIRQLFVKNERVATLLDCGAQGRIAAVMVGASNVGSIALSYADLRTNVAGSVGAAADFPSPPSLAKGGELGRFNLGSTVVLLVSDLRFAWSPLLPGQWVKVGERLGTFSGTPAH